jgi:hypothetical protein
MNSLHLTIDLQTTVNDLRASFSTLQLSGCYIMLPAHLPVVFFKLQVTCVVLVATPTASTPPAGLEILYVRVLLGACAQVVALLGPMIAPVIAVVKVPAQAPLSTGNAMRLTPNSGHTVAFRLHVTVT